MTDLNALIREAAGRCVDVPRLEPETDARPKLGDVGMGRGSSSAPRRRTATADVNARIRAAARLVRQAQINGGVSIDIDAPWGD